MNERQIDWLSNEYNNKHLDFCCKEFNIYCKVHYYDEYSVKSSIRTFDRWVSKSAPAAAIQNNQEIRKYIKRNDIINSLNTREQNEDFPINEHRFVKRNGLLNLIHDANITTSNNEIINSDIANATQVRTFNQTDEQISLKALNERVNKLYDFCTQVQEFLIQQFS